EPPAAAVSPATRRAGGGSTTKNTNARKGGAKTAAAKAPASVARDTPTTTASRHHAVTSPTAAQVSAATPSSVRDSPRSVRMRARTGNAVIDIAIPMNSANGRKRTPGGPNAGYSANATPHPSANGSAMLACDTTMNAAARLRSELASNSSPTTNM